MRARTATLAALAAILLAGCSPSADPPAAPPPSSPTAEVTPAAHGVEAPATAIPWTQVGAGWVLATWSPYVGHGPGVEIPNQPDFDTVTTTLFLVDPEGGRYPITAFPPGKGGPPELIDWSGDKNRALLRAGGPKETITEVDLHTGAQTPIALPDTDAYPRYTMPDGKAVLLTTGGYQKPRTLTRVDLTGKPQLSYPVGQDFDGFLSRPDGTELVLGNSTGLALMGNDGTPGRPLPVAGQSDCAPVRWWDDDATVVLARCGDDVRQLWRVPVDGSTPTALTAPNDGQSGPNLGDVDAWELSAGTYVQDVGACGVIYLAKLNADGTTTKVDVPDVQAGSIDVVGVHGDSLRLQANAACGGGVSLIDYDPAHNATTFLLGGPVNGGGVDSAVAFKGQR
jgi:TolB protein